MATTIQADETPITNGILTGVLKVEKCQWCGELNAYVPTGEIVEAIDIHDIAAVVTIKEQDNGMWVIIARECR